MTRPRIDWRDVAMTICALLGACLIGYAMGLAGGLRELFMGVHQ